MLKYQFIKPYRDPANAKQYFVEIDADENVFRLERRLFNIRTYDILRRSTDWDKISPANDFVTKEFDEDEYEYLVRLFVRAKRDLANATDKQSLMEAISAIDEKVAKTFGKLAIPARLFNYVCQDKRITMPDFTNIGKRLQDTPEKTFHEDEYHLINTIVIIAKMLFPLFGEIINKVKNIADVDNNVKEIIAFGIVNTLLLRDFDTIIKKLKNYISKLIDQALSDDSMLIFRGITSMGLTHDRVAKMIVKNFVNHDLYKENGNIMRSLAVTIKRANDAETSSSNKRLTYKPRILPETGEDGRNISLLENAINTTNEPVEVPIIVKLGVEKFINDYLVQNNIRKSIFDSAVDFYKVTFIPPTPVNEICVAMFVADPIGSAYCVKYMDMEMMIKIIVIIQIYAIRSGFNSIIPLLSMIPSTVTKTTSDATDSHIIINDGRGTGKINYALSLREATDHLNDFTSFNFDELLKNIMMFVVGNLHTFNVAPSIMELGNTGTTTHDEEFIIKYDENVIAELHRFMYHLLLQADPGRKI